MASKPTAGRRGWNESKMGLAMDIAERTGFSKESPEFLKAADMEAKKELFPSHTMKKGAAKVDHAAAARFVDLLGDEDSLVEDDCEVVLCDDEDMFAPFKAAAAAHNAQEFAGRMAQ